VVFDNEQVVGKRYVVGIENPHIPISIITSQAYLEMDDVDQIQTCYDLSPKHWMFQTLNPPIVEEL